ncbi:hypothetical protein K0B04_04515, partial [Patescibacteria group bacterium]|nr:hypothetical protein [Patescibacteria group bacterium]
EVVLLPYSKQLGEDTLIKEYNFSGSEPVFIDHYMVYSPIHSRIENKNALDFKNDGSFYIQNGDVSDIVNAVNSNHELFNALVSQNPSNFFRIRNLAGDLTDLEKTEIEITFSCLRENLDSDGIKADFYYVDENGEVQKEDEKLMYFPGCSEIGKPEVVRVEFDLPYTESEFLYVRLQSVLPNDIEDIKIIISDMVIEPVYLSKDKGHTVIDSGGLTTSARVPITNYIFSDPYHLSFDVNLNENGDFDMSVPINELIIEGVLKDRFLIWSTQKYLPVRLPD